jgi:hypothetical protein
MLTGCQETKFSSTILNPFNLDLPFLPYREPVRIGIVHEGTGIFNPATWDVRNIGSPWQPLQSRLQTHLNAPVQFVDLEPFQVAAHLQSGRLNFAFLGAADYIEMSKEFGELGQVIAVSDVATRQGLIVTNAQSEIRTLADVKGKRFAFGPSGDAVLDDGAKQALADAGVTVDDIQKELIPVPGVSCQYHISSREVAFEIVYGLGTQVGVIERADYDAYPDEGGSFLLRTFSKSDFRILGQTKIVRMETIPEGPVVAANNVSAELTADVTEFLLDAAKNHRRALSTMGLAGFHRPPSDVNEEMARLAAAGIVKKDQAP